MEWFSIHERFRLRDGDLAVVKVDKRYHRAGVIVAVYKNESFWDSIVLDDPDMFQEEWTVLDDVCLSFGVIGINIFETLNQYN